jgi:hypothetical protein
MACFSSSLLAMRTILKLHHLHPMSDDVLPQAVIIVNAKLASSG